MLIDATGRDWLATSRWVGGGPPLLAVAGGVALAASFSRMVAPSSRRCG
jgi:hypothetical protein